MGQANAYFQFVIKEHATYIKLFPAALEGNVIEIGELTEYLERHGCPDYNLKELVAAINSNEMTEIMVGDIYPIQINEEMSVTVSADHGGGMQVLSGCRRHEYECAGNLKGFNCKRCQSRG